MSRKEENTELLMAIDNRFGQEPKVRYEEAVNMNLSAIYWVLADISKSLAVIADKSKEG